MKWMGRGIGSCGAVAFSLLLFLSSRANGLASADATPRPQNPVENSIFLPQELFPSGLTYTWSVTKGADLSWVPIPFERSLQLAYGRTRYGTGYFIVWKLMPGLTNLSRSLKSWTTNDVPPPEV